MRILDVSAGNRGIWFDKLYQEAVFVDVRAHVYPSVVADSRNLPFKNDTFDLVVFDPPHVNFGKNANMSRDYGHHTTSEIRNLVKYTSQEICRVLKRSGLVALKWNDHDQKLSTILNLMYDFVPLFGHKVSSRTNRRSSTYWVMLRQLANQGEEGGNGC